MYKLTGYESVLSVAVAIGHNVTHPPGNTVENLLHAAFILFTSPYVEKHLQGCTILSHKIEQSCTNSFLQAIPHILINSDHCLTKPQTVSCKQYRTYLSIQIIVIQNLRQEVVLDIRWECFGIWELNVLTDPRLIHSITAIGERKPLDNSQIAVHRNVRVNVMPWPAVFARWATSRPCLALYCSWQNSHSALQRPLESLSTGIQFYWAVSHFLHSVCSSGAWQEAVGVRDFRFSDPNGPATEFIPNECN